MGMNIKKRLGIYGFYTMIENIKTGIDRWERVADYPKS